MIWHESHGLTSASIRMVFRVNLSSISSWHLDRWIKDRLSGTSGSSCHSATRAAMKHSGRSSESMSVWDTVVWIHFSDDDDRVLLFKGIVKQKDFVVVQPGEQVHFSQSRDFLLGTGGDTLCGVLHFAYFLSHTLHIGKSTSVGRTQCWRLQVGVSSSARDPASIGELPSNFFVDVIEVSQSAHFPEDCLLVLHGLLLDFCC